MSRFCPASPLRSRRRLPRVLVALAAALVITLGAGVLGAQTPATSVGPLPEAPAPQAGLDSSALAVLAQAQNSVPKPANVIASENAPHNSGGAAEGQRETETAPVVVMAPHGEDSIWWISGQANIIFQGRLPFHSQYQGPSSFRNSAEYKTSMVGTLFTVLRPIRSVRYNNDLIFDLESAGGREIE